MYQLLPKVNDLALGESAKSARGTKQKKSKARINLSVSANSRGAYVLPPYFISTAKKPDCFVLANP